MLLQCNVIDYNSCATLAYDDLTLPNSATYKYQHALEQDIVNNAVYSHLDVLGLIPRDGRLDLSFNGRWSLKRDALHGEIPRHHRPIVTHTQSLLGSVELALQDLGKFGVLDISDFDPNSADRVSYRLSKEKVFFGTVLDGEYFFNQNADHIRDMMDSGEVTLSKCPTTKKTAGWNRLM